MNSTLGSLFTCVRLTQYVKHDTCVAIYLLCGSINESCLRWLGLLYCICTTEKPGTKHISLRYPRFLMYHCLLPVLYYQHNAYLSPPLPRFLKPHSLTLFSAVNLSSMRYYVVDRCLGHTYLCDASPFVVFILTRKATYFQNGTF